MNDNIDLIIKKIKNAMYLHRKGMYDYDMLVDFELDHNQWNELLTYLEQLQTNWNSLKDYSKENIKILENRLSTPFCNFEMATKELMIHQNYLDKMNELEGEKDK